MALTEVKHRLRVVVNVFPTPTRMARFHEVQFSRAGLVRVDYLHTGVIDEVHNGRMVILFGHEDRENDGDLLNPSQMATREAITFMATQRLGLICLPRLWIECRLRADCSYALSPPDRRGTDRRRML